jgi:hypothetical protein
MEIFMIIGAAGIGILSADIVFAIFACIPKAYYYIKNAHHKKHEFPEYLLITPSVKEWMK